MGQCFIHILAHFYLEKRENYSRIFAKSIPLIYVFVDIISNNNIKLMVMSNKSVDYTFALNFNEKSAISHGTQSIDQ